MEKVLTRPATISSLGKKPEKSIANIAKPTDSSVGEFIGKLFNSRDIMHVRHLNPTKSGLPSSYAEHKALNEYYDELGEFIDSFTESYQGKHGLLEIEIPKAVYEEPVSHLTSLAKYIEQNKDAMFPDSYLNNQIDELTTLIYSTLYKLKFLK